jgi:hypothetical protein
MNDNTILRIKVPAHLYESVKEQLSLTEAKKQNYGAGYSVVKEKKMAVPKEDVEEGIHNDEMEKVEEAGLDKIQAALSNSSVVSALKILNSAITNRADWAKVLKGLGKALSSKEGSAFDKALQSNPNVRRSDQQLASLSGEKIQMSKVEENINEYFGVDPKLDIVTLLLGAGVPIATAAIALVQQIGFKGALDLLKKSKLDPEKKKEAEKAIISSEKGVNENFNEAKNMSYQEIKEGEDKTNPALEEKAYPYFDTNNVDRHDEIVDLFPIVWADLKKNTNIYAGLVIDLLFHWVHGTKETGLMKLYKDKFLKKGKNK